MINSGKCIITEFYEFKASPELIKESEEKNKPLVMTGILQKADTLNRNGRVYPYEILKREVDKYMELVESGTAGGELDHPDCHYLSDSQILTKNGWKLLSEIDENEEILTLNIETNKIEIQTIDKKINQSYKGDIYHIHGRNIDVKVTPNHRFLVHDRNDKLKYITAGEIYNTNTNKLSIPKKGEWAGEEMEYFTLKGASDYKKNSTDNFKKTFSNSIKIKSEDWFEFMGWYLSEGSSSGVKSKKHFEDNNYSVKITQKKEETKLNIQSLFERLPFNKRKVEYVNGKVDYVFTDKRLHEYLFPLGSSSEKYIPTELKQASPRLLNILFDAFLLGDGRNVQSKSSNDIYYKKKSVFSTSKQLIEDLQEVLLKMGGNGNITTYQPKDRFFNEISYVEKEIDNEDGTLSLVKEKVLTKRKVYSKDSKLQYNLHISTSDRIYLDKRFVKVEKIEGDGNVYCVRVKNGNFYTMRNGKSHWTGNSAVVSLANVSHRVTDMWWQGKDLYGKVLIAEETSAGGTLKGLLKAGFMLGISSRGVGSVKSVNGKDMVQEDFELIAFDFVSSPSTPGAYLFKEGKELAMKGMVPLEDHSKKVIKSDESYISKQNEYYSKLLNLHNSDFWKNI
jgi:intein/homing endonuclease